MYKQLSYGQQHLTLVMHQVDILIEEFCCKLYFGVEGALAYETAQYKI